MERTCIKNNFVGFPQRVAPLQSIFKEFPGVAPEVLEFLCGLQKNLVDGMIKGACALARHRGSTEVSAEDLLLHLDMRWNIDPLLVTATSAENYYRVKEATDKIDLSLSPEPLPRKKRTRKDLPKLQPSSSKVNKNSSRKSKCDQASESIHSEYKVKSQSADICPDHQLKTLSPFLNNPPELKAELQLLFKINLPNSLEFSGNNYTLNPDCVGDIRLPPGVVLKKAPREEKDDMEYIHYEVDAWFVIDEKTHTFKLGGLGKYESTANDALKSPEAPMHKFQPNVEEQTTTCKRSVKVPPCIDHSESKVPTQVHFDPETGILKKTGLKKDIYKLSPGVYMPKSNKERSQPKFQPAKQASVEMSCPDSQICKMPTEKSKQAVSGGRHSFLKTAEEACQPSAKMPHPDSGAHKNILLDPLSDRKSKKSECDQSAEILHSKARVDSQIPNKFPELKPEERFLFKINVPRSLEFSGKNYKLDSDCVGDVHAPPSIVFKKAPCEEKDDKEYIHYEVDAWFKRDEETHTFKLGGLGKYESSANDALKSPEAPIHTFQSNVEEQSTTCKHSVKVPLCLDHSESKVPTQVRFDPETDILKKTGLKKDSSRRLFDLDILSVCKEKSLPKFQLAKQPSIEMLTKKVKRAVSGVKRLHTNSHGRKLLLKRRKEEILRYYNIPVKTAEAARKGYAIILLRIAGMFY